MKTTIRTSLIIGFASVLTTTSFGQVASQWTIDENGPALLSGTIVGYSNGRYQVDPISGLQGWYYQLNSNVPGDLVLIEPGPTNVISDLLRFDGHGVYFFSDLEPGELNPDHADVAHMPVPVGNYMVLLENGPEGANGALYFPTPNQPGADLSGILPGLNYVIISDVPEPHTLAFWMAGAAVLAWRFRRAQRYHS